MNDNWGGHVSIDFLHILIKDHCIRRDALRQTKTTGWKIMHFECICEERCFIFCSLSFTGRYFDYHCVFCLGEPATPVNGLVLLLKNQSSNPSKVVKEIVACDFRGLVLSDLFFPDGLVINIDPTYRK